MQHITATGYILRPRGRGPQHFAEETECKNALRFCMFSCSRIFVKSDRTLPGNLVKKAEISQKKLLHQGYRYGIFFRHVNWACCAQNHAEICEDAGGGRPRDGKFPRSMSDFKPGETNNGKSI